MPKAKRGEVLVAERDDQLVPLAVGATAAYFEIARQSPMVGSEDELAEIAHLVAIALSTVAPIYMRTGGAAGAGALLLKSHEVYELLFQPRKLTQRGRSLDGLLIRRRDLRMAVATLKATHVAFGRN